MWRLDNVEIKLNTESEETLVLVWQEKKTSLNYAHPKFADLPC